MSKSSCARLKHYARPYGEGTVSLARAARDAGVCLWEMMDLVRSRKVPAQYVQAARYPIHKQAIDTVGVGLRGWGSHTFAAWVWGLNAQPHGIR